MWQEHTLLAPGLPQSAHVLRVALVRTRYHRELLLRQPVPRVLLELIPHPLVPLLLPHATLALLVLTPPLQRLNQLLPAWLARQENTASQLHLLARAAHLRVTRALVRRPASHLRRRETYLLLDSSSEL